MVGGGGWAGGQEESGKKRVSREGNLFGNHDAGHETLGLLVCEEHLFVKAFVCEAVMFVKHLAHGLELSLLVHVLGICMVPWDYGSRSLSVVAVGDL